MTSALPLIVAAVAVFVGAMLQRTTGMGFALVSAPFLMMALGPLDGIVVTNLFGACTSFVSACQLRADYDAPRARWLIPAGVVGCLPGALVVRSLPSDWVGVVVGGIVLIALLITLRTPSGRFRDTGALRLITGFASGFMNTAAGVGGPALAVYTRGVGWARRPFAATASVIFCLQGVAALLFKWHWPTFALLGWVLLAAAVPLGVVAGQRLHRRLDDRTAMRVVMTLALVGTVLALGKALWALAG